MCLGVLEQVPPFIKKINQDSSGLLARHVSQGLPGLASGSMTVQCATEPFVAFSNIMSATKK